MTKGNFEKVHPWVLAHEGGYVDHPKDPGGATNHGVTQRTYDAYRARNGLSHKSVRRITPSERDEIYRLQYWDKIMGDDLPSGVDYAVYDFAVNSGPARSAKYLQRVVGVTQDGVIGLQTIAAVKQMRSQDVIRQLCRNRMAFLRRLKHWSTFGKGWTRRVVGKWDGVQIGDHGVIDRATQLANGAQDIPAPKIIQDGSGARSGDATSFWARLLTLLVGTKKPRREPGR